jgi:hypothetical protein
MPSIQLNGGQHFQLRDANQKSITLENASPEQLKGASLHIDMDGDGKFGGPKDLSFNQAEQIAALVDQKKGNADQSIPFVDEIENHLLNVPTVNQQVAHAATQGKKAKETSIFSLSKKMEYGKEAFFATQKAFQTDPANPKARMAYASALIGIHNSSFSGKASKSLGIDLSKLTQEVVKELASDKRDITGQMLLKCLYHVTKNGAEKQVDANLAQLKQKFPAEYAQADKAMEKIIQETTE